MADVEGGAESLLSTQIGGVGILGLLAIISGILGGMGQHQLSLWFAGISFTLFAAISTYRRNHTNTRNPRATCIIWAISWMFGIAMLGSLLGFVFEEGVQQTNGELLLFIGWNLLIPIGIAIGWFWIRKI